MEYKITKEESTKIAQLFYTYCALKELIIKVEPNSTIYNDLIARIGNLNTELEIEKLKIVEKYNSITDVNYTFNFTKDLLIVNSK